MSNEVKESPKDFFDTFEAGFLVGVFFTLLVMTGSLILYFDFRQCDVLQNFS